jgi:hypothetical protein
VINLDLVLLVIVLLIKNLEEISWHWFFYIDLAL